MVANTKLGKKEIKEKIAEGYIHVVVLFEVIGSPKAHVEQAMKLFLENITKDSQVIGISEDIEEIIEVDGGLFSIAAEAEYLILGIEKLTWIVFNYMPASIEIKAPSELTFRDKDMGNWLNDLLAKLHEVNTIHTSLKSENEGLIRNLNVCIRNSILLTLSAGPQTSSEIAKKVGIGEPQALPFLEGLIKERKIAQDGKKYKRL